MAYVPVPFTIIAGKLIRSGITMFTKGGATAAPGLYALKLNPMVIRQLTKTLAKGNLIVAGTNGKTTTARLISSIMQAQGNTVVQNKEGSNLLRGIASTLVTQSALTGTVGKDYGVWEVDEATLPGMLHEVSPKLVVLTNLFRDQLDRYGEVAKIRTLWYSALQELPPATTLVLNADDPSIAHFSHTLHERVVYFGIDAPSMQNEVSGTADANFCATCSSQLTYEAIYYSHIGKYKCKKCGFLRPEPAIIATHIRETENDSTFTVHTPTWQAEIVLHVPGIYNIYNALAAISAGYALQVPQETILQAITGFTSVFGRVESVAVGETTLKLYLVKNPTGYNEVIHVLTHAKEPYKLIVAGLNDNFADGRDISWIWDVDFETLAKRATTILATGTRAHDLAVRFKYADFTGKLAVIEDFEAVLGRIAQLKQPATVPMLFTYTSMLAFRKYLVQKGYLTHYLHEET